MPNALLATFHDQPALVHPGMHKQFEAFIHEAQNTLSRIEASNDNVVMSDDFWPASDSWLAAYRPYIVKSGILLIPVKGVLIHGLGYAFGSYATGYVYITKALERGLADPEVKGIAFICDSPGGHVAGNFELVDKIYAARGQKPMRGYASESAYSACYSIISATDPGYVTVSRTGGVGSIGVVTMHIDVSEAMANEGVKVTFIHFGKHKVDGNAYEALPPEVKERIQARIDSLGEIFVSTVARNRGMDAKAVRDTEALTFTAEEATSNGLADEIGALDDAIAAFAAEISNPRRNDMTASIRTIGSAPSVEHTRQRAHEEGFAEGNAAGLRAGALAERARISAIISSEQGEDRPTMALKLAMSEKFASLDAGTVIELLADCPSEKVKSRAEAALDNFFGSTSEASAKRAKLELVSSDSLPRHERGLRAFGHEPRES
jgi:signal peptide peptidase SppA